MTVEASVRQKAISSIVIKYSSLPISKGIKELQDELLNTTNQLSDLINSRYQDFISLPDGLTGMDKVLEDIKLDHIEGDKLLGVGANVANELRRRIELLDSEINQCKESLKKRRKLQKEIKILSYYMQLDQGRKRVQDLFDSLISLIDAHHNNSSEDSVNLIFLGLDRVTRELVYVSGNLDLAPTLESDSTVIADISKSIDKLKSALLEIVNDLLAKCMEKVGLFDNLDIPPSSVNNHLGVLIHVCHELNSFNMVVDVFTSCLIEPFLLEMEMVKKTGLSFKDCLNLILKFAKEKCKPIFAISAKGSDESSHSYTKSAGLLLVTGVWDKCITWVMKEFESSFLVSNSISTFHDNYSNFRRVSQDFEVLCLEVKQMENFKSSSVTKEVNKKWQLSVYFQLFHNDIVEEFESCFSSMPIAKDSGKQVATPHSAINRAIDRFWGSEAAIRAISPRIWKSTLVVIHRYISWNTSNIPVSVESAVSSLIVPPEADVHLLARNYSILFSNMIKIENVLSEKIPLVLGVPPDNNQVWPLLKPALHDAFEIDSCAGKMKALLIDSLACISYDVLTAADKIPAQYRRTGKELPTSPSYFILDCFFKIKDLVQNHCTAFDTEGRQELLCQAAIKTVRLYSALVSKTLESVKKTEEALKKFKVRKQPSVGTNPINEIRDEDKIRQQFSIDAEHFGKEVSKLGLDISVNEEYKQFISMITTATATNNSD